MNEAEQLDEAADLAKRAGRTIGPLEIFIQLKPDSEVKEAVIKMMQGTDFGLPISHAVHSLDKKLVKIFDGRGQLVWSGVCRFVSSGN